MPDRIAVIGNCQSVPVAAILSKMCPRIRVEAVPYTQIRKAEQAVEAAKTLGSYDLILIQDVEKPANGPLRLSRVVEDYSNVVQFPAIRFNGFHPDFVIVEGPGKKKISEGRGKRFVSAAGTIHSLIVAAAYLEGVPEEQVRPLFAPPFFKQLGYFEAFERARESLLTRAQNLGYDFADSFEMWKSRGIFMHTINHPIVTVLHSIAEAVAKRAGLDVAPVNEDEIDDGMGEKQILPVYPHIAVHLEVPGGMLFKKRVVRGERKAYTMRQYIKKTYQFYREGAREGFDEENIQRAAGLLREYLRSRA